MNIGNNIAKVRELKNLTQTYVAKQLGISQQAYSKIERKSSISEDRLSQIANIFSCSVDAIKNYSENNIMEFLKRYY